MVQGLMVHVLCSSRRHGRELSRQMVARSMSLNGNEAFLTSQLQQQLLQLHGLHCCAGLTPPPGHQAGIACQHLDWGRPIPAAPDLLHFCNEQRPQNREDLVQGLKNRLPGCDRCPVTMLMMIA